MLNILISNKTGNLSVYSKKNSRIKCGVKQGTHQKKGNKGKEKSGM